MTLVLVRHASAGDRHEWDGDDRLRPLDKKGRKQAARLLDVLADVTVRRIVSSPYLRCVQTVEPLARARGLEVESAPELGVEHQHSTARRSSPRCSATTRSPASTAGSSSRSASTCASARAPSGSSGDSLDERPEILVERC